MLIVKVKDGNIDRALKVLKNKVVKTKMVEELHERSEYTKPSVARRQVIKDAAYRQKKRDEIERLKNG